MFPLDLYARVRVFCAQLHTRPRVQRAPGLPCALCFRGKDEANLGRKSRRENAIVILDRHRPRSGRSSIPEAAVIEPISRGVLDPRLRGDDEFSGASVFIVIADEAKSRSPDERSDIRGHCTDLIWQSHADYEACIEPQNPRQHAPAKQRRIRRWRKFGRPARQVFPARRYPSPPRARPARPAPAAATSRW